MNKELFISSSPHETKVAVWEDDQLVEVYYERDTDVGLVGGIYKGRVSRVLPGMQSAFVDVGLERDGFLYVSDFFLEDSEEYDKVFDEAEARTAHAMPEETPAMATGPVQAVSPVGEPPAEVAAARSVAPPPAPEPAATPSAEAAPAVVPPQPAESAPPATAAGAPAAPRQAGEQSEYRRFGHRGRHRRRGGRGFGEQKFPPRPVPERPDHGQPHSFEVLPGESLAKYSHAAPATAEQSPASAPPEAAAACPVGVSQQEPPRQSAETPRAEAKAPSAPASGKATAASTPTPPATAAPAAPATTAPVAGSGEPKSASKPRHLWDRIVSTAFRESSHTLEQRETQPAKAVRAPEAEPPVAPAASSAEAPVAQAPSPPQLSAPPPKTASGETTSQGTPAVEAAPLTAAGSVPSAGGDASTPAAGSRTATEPTDRTYTLREPHQRPPFAPPRGRRGRRGLGRRPPPRPEGRPEPARASGTQLPQIAEMLKQGQEILVQIAKEPLGTKGARITSHIALPGRYLVYMPTIDHTGVSRKIGSEEERLRLRNIILENKGSLTGGFIVRTASAGRSEEEFKADIKFLAALWNNIRTKTEQTKAPALIHRDLDLVQRILRDTLSPDFKSIRMDSEVEYARVVDFVSRSQPSLVGKVKLYTRETPLFEEFGIQAEIEKALKPKVWLKSGGYIVINQTEALVAIDVNTGKYVGKTNRLEDTILKTNIDAVNEIIRQIRLRDLGGIIVIDFIDMDERRNRNKVVQALDEALRHDRAPTKLLAFNDFGLVAITRKRVKQSLERTLSEPCNYCTGSGWIKSVTTVCNEILAEVRKMAKQIEGNSITLRVNPEVAHALKSREGELLSELESLTHKDVIIKSDPTVHQERFEIF